MRTSAALLTTVALTTLIGLGCARQTEVVKLYEDEARSVQSYSRLLVVSISGDRSQQERFESELVDRLRAEQVDAVASYTMLDASDGVLQDDINRASDTAGADGILITHIASLDVAAEVEKGREDIKTECRGGDPFDYFLYDHEVLREPDSVNLAHTVIVITNLYDSATQDRVWTIQSTCFEKASMSEVVIDESIAIVRQLRIDQLI